MDDSSVWWLHLLSIGFVNIAFAFLVGGVSFLRMTRFAETAWAIGRADTVVALLRGTSIATLAGTVLVLWTQAAEMSEQSMWSATSQLHIVLTRTHAGQAWALGATALLLFAICLFAEGTSALRRRAVPWMACCLALFAFSRSWASHAEAAGGLLPFAIDMVHLLGTSVWAGLVLLYASVGMRGPPLSSMHERRECASFVTALSSTAAWMLVVVAMTGAASSWSSLSGTADPFLSTLYGRLLVGKLGLVCIAICLGAFNRWRVMPNLLAGLRRRKLLFARPLKAFEKILQAESLVLLVVLIAAAALSVTPPPGH